MENQPKGKAKVQPGTAKKSIKHGGKTTKSRTKTKPVDSGSMYVVSGSVVNADSTPATGLTVVSYDQDLRKKQLLGKAITDAEGRYEISYTSRKFLRAEKSSADLRVVVVDAKGKEVVSSEVLFNAPVETVVDLTLPPDVKTLSEFELLLGAILPLLAGQGKGDNDLKITELEEKDIAFLSQESGQPSERITFLLAAVKASVATAESAQTSIATHVIPSGVSKIPVEAFYGWFRKSLPADLNKLWEQPVAMLRTTLKSAITENIIPARFVEQVENIFDKIPHPQRQDLKSLVARVADVTSSSERPSLVSR